ncbi:COX15-CtaA-domain-containing protein [Hymenopellis radicata]|nr:COX15-CtaA-domain-containing protein [Hymenopellis radicata]
MSSCGLERSILWPTRQGAQVSSIARAHYATAAKAPKRASKKSTPPKSESTPPKAEAASIPPKTEPAATPPKSEPLPTAPKRASKKSNAKAASPKAEAASIPPKTEPVPTPPKSERLPTPPKVDPAPAEASPTSTDQLLPSAKAPKRVSKKSTPKAAPPKSEPTPPKAEAASITPKAEPVPTPPKSEPLPPPPKSEPVPTPPKSKALPTPPKVEPAPSPTPTDQLPILPPKSVGIWLMISSTLVLLIVVVGGVTRLTESGLSITEWKPITGAIPPLSHEDWEEEFAKYKETPEFKMLNHSITLEEFKRIFFWEWSHRFLGRFVGMVFVLPLAYFIARKKISKNLAWKLSGLSALFAAQGLMGWYMVKSGLDEQLLETPGAVPRVSQYRLAAHLGLAFILYVAMFSTGLATIKDYKFATSGLWNGQTLKDFQRVIQSPLSRKLLLQTRVLFGMVFLTAMSGAFVAGLDAGLLYNEFPLMGGRLAPPSEELLDPRYSKRSDRSDLWWRSMLENPVTVQFDHRVLATLTYFGIAALYLQSLRRGALPAATRGATRVAFGMANIQVILGITTLWYMVPVPLAAGHQAGSVLLLTAMIHALMAFRRPSTAAVAWQNALRASRKAVS